MFGEVMSVFHSSSETQ